MAMRDDWTALEKLIFLRGSGAAGGAGGWSTISGNPVSFTAKAAPLRQLEVAFSPVQDLHGYDYPWPAGGGVNKANFVDGKGLTIDGTIDTTTSRTTTVDAIPIKADTSYYIHFKETVSGSNANYRAILAVYTAGNMSLRTSGIRSGDLLNTSGGDEFRVCIYDNAGSQTASISVNEPMVTTSATAPQFYSPYSNECPISGWDSVTVNRTGKNLCYKVLPYQSTLWGDGNKYSKILNVPGTSACFKCVEGETYIVSGAIGRNRALVGYFDSDPERYSQSVYPNTTAVTMFADGFSFTAEHTAYALCYLANTTLSDVNIQIELGSTATAYEPYQGNTISISLGQTVYSGTLDVLSGKMTVTWAKKTLNGSEDWAGTPPSGWYARENNLKKLTSYVGHMLADTLPAGAPGENRLYGYIDINNSYPGENWIYYKNSAFASKAEVIAFFAANPTEVVYELATPLTIQLTPQEVESLAGDNTMWSTANEDMTITYRSN